MTSRSEQAPDGMYPEFEKSSSRRAFLQLGLVAVAGATAGLLADGKKLSDAEAIKVRNAKARVLIDFLINNPAVTDDVDGVENFLISVLQGQNNKQTESVTASLDERSLRSLIDHSRPEVAVLAANILCNNYPSALDTDPKLVDKCAKLFIPHALYRVEALRPKDPLEWKIDRLRGKVAKKVKPFSRYLAGKIGAGWKRQFLDLDQASDEVPEEVRARTLALHGLSFVATENNGGIPALQQLKKLSFPNNGFVPQFIQQAEENQARRMSVGPNK